MVATKKSKKPTTVKRSVNKTVKKPTTAKTTVKKTKSRPKITKKLTLSQQVAKFGRKKILAVLSIACFIVIAGLLIIPRVAEMAIANDIGDSAVLGRSSAPRSPRGFRVSSKSHNSITVSWKTNLVHDGADYYEIEFGGRYFTIGVKTDAGRRLSASYDDPSGNFSYYRIRSGLSLDHYVVFSKGISSNTNYTFTIKAQKKSSTQSAGVTAKGRTDNNSSGGTNPSNPAIVNNGQITFAKWYNKNSKQAKLIGGDVAQVKFMSNKKQDGYTIWCFRPGVRNKAFFIEELENTYRPTDTYRYSKDYYIYSDRDCFVYGYLLDSANKKVYSYPSPQISHP